MEQEKAINTITVAGKVTLKAILTACYLVAKELSDRTSYQKANQTFMGGNSALSVSCNQVSKGYGTPVNQ